MFFCLCGKSQYTYQYSTRLGLFQYKKFSDIIWLTGKTTVHGLKTLTSHLEMSS